MLRTSNLISIFPSIQSALKNISSKKDMSDLILEALSNILLDIVYLDNNFDYDMSIMKQTKITDNEGIVVGQKSYRDSPSESVTQYGIIGQKAEVLLTIDKKEVTEYLTNYINREGQSLLAYKLAYREIYDDFHTRELGGMVAMMLKADLKSFRFSMEEIDAFIHGTDLDIDYIRVNDLSFGKTYVEDANLEIKEIYWNMGTLSFKLEVDEVHYVGGSI